MIENLYEFDTVEEHKDVWVMTCDMSNGFAWFRDGERIDEDGFRFPEVTIRKANVQILTNGKERSAAWQPMFQE